MQVQLQDIDVEVVQGDIADQPDIMAVVNAANAELKTGGGVAGALHRAAGPGLAMECRPMAPINPGEAVITSGHELPNKYVIHCLGPIYGEDTPEDQLLANCYQNALRLADKHNIDSIAFPAISTGAFGYPIEEATEIALSTIKETLPELKNIDRIRFVLYSEKDMNIYVDKLSDWSERNV
jgi:O-acetyl-ADP-ribose deacetylase (regulator of RNase III)